MNINELDKLNNLDSSEKVITVNDLSNKTDRTLLFGYDCDRNTWHIYLLNGYINIHIYNLDGTIYRTEGNDIESNQEFIPNKRLYPETCDFEFCKLLIEREDRCGTFTTFNHDREIKDFYGKL